MSSNESWAPLNLANEVCAPCVAERRLVRLPSLGPPTFLPVVRLRSQTPSSRAVILLSGGPGESCLDALASGTYRELVTDLVPDADVIAFDQRGVGSAVPSIPPVTRWDLPLAEPGRRSDVIAVAKSRAAESRDYWAEREVDLSSFTLAQSALDVVTLLNELGLQRVSIFGASYGSQLGQAVLALRDRRIDRAALCNVEGLAQTLKLPRLVEDALVRGIGQSRVNRLGELVGALDTRPARVQLSAGATVGLSGFDLQRVAARLMGSQDGLRRLVRGLDAEAETLLRVVGREIVVWRLGPFGGIQHVIDSTTHTSAARSAQIEAERHTTVLGDIADFPLPHVWEPWGVQTSPAIGLDSSVPTLLVSGTHDCRTPLENLDEIRPQLRGASDHVLEGGTHHLREYLADPPTRRKVVKHLVPEVA